jgi:hypothetical protein
MMAQHEICDFLSVSNVDRLANVTKKDLRNFLREHYPALVDTADTGLEWVGVGVSRVGTFV